MTDLRKQLDQTRADLRAVRIAYRVATGPTRDTLGAHMTRLEAAERRMLDALTKAPRFDAQDYNSEVGANVLRFDVL